VITGWLFLPERLQIIPLAVLDSVIGVNFDTCFHLTVLGTKRRKGNAKKKRKTEELDKRKVRR